MVKKAKIIFLGDTAVGKSCIISAINGHSISLNHEVFFELCIADHWDGLLNKIISNPKELRIQTSTLGYCWSGEVS